MNLLIIDKNEQLRRIYEDELYYEGYNTCGAGTARQALDLLTQLDKIDLITLDPGVEDMDGADLLNKLRKRLPETPIIIHSAYGTCSHDFRFWLADACIGKSPDLTELKENIKILLESNKQYY
ncbi:MAG: response regulator [candidate division Zixibacteria bacterium]|nr:response regulator [candidate division Zixibacteria bacterium]